jgi:hypothetical protein
MLTEPRLRRNRPTPTVTTAGVLLLAVLVMLVGSGRSFAQGIGGLIVEWDGNITDPDLDGYRVYLSTDPTIFSLPPDQAALLAITQTVEEFTTAWNFNSLDAGQIYYVAVTAFDVSGNESLFSNVASGQPGTDPVLTSVFPSSALQGTSNLTVTLSGVNFDSSATVDFGAGINVASLDTTGAPALVSALVDVDPLAEVNTRNVAVTNPGNVSSTLAEGFEVTLDIARADINGSARIDGGDLVQLGAAFAAQQSDPLYSVAVDLNVDGVIDGLDLALLLTYFGFVAPF